MDEYIKREDALKAITWNGLYEPPEVIHLTLLTAQKNIRKIPTANVVPKSEVAEIIDEAFKMMEDNFVNTPIYKVFPHRLKAALKKKYTE